MTQKNIFAMLFSFVMAVVLILAITCPWFLHFQGEFLDHWDPPFHAWKLEFIAKRILAGDWFVQTTNTNMLYPYSGTFYYEALQWPPALFAAALFKFTTMPSELIYHVTLIVFWALSAPCMYYLLRQLNCNIIPSIIGALIFCILPHRISYMVEFQMEMIFVMPLFFAFVLRFLCKPTIVRGLLVSFSLWLFAVTELYQAIFVVIATPFLALAFLTKTPKILKTKQFWMSAAFAGVFGIALLFVMLAPYLQQHSEGAVMRPLAEIRQHSAQPFSFLVPFGRFFLWHFPVKVDEFSMYPTIPILILFTLAGIYWMVNVYRNKSQSQFVFISSIVFLLSFLSFLVLCLIIQFTNIPFKKICWYAVTAFSFLSIIGSFILSIFHLKNESHRVTFIKGLLFACVLFYFLSLGPLISLGFDRSVEFSFSNWVYLICYRKILPFLSGFRVVSRFGVLVLFCMIIVATVFCDIIYPRLFKNKRRVLYICLLFVIIVGVILEAIPNKKTVTRYIKVDNPRQSPAIARFIEEHPICTLAICPSGPRRIEGPRMFSLLKGDWPYIYAWGGYFPTYSTELASEINSYNPQKIHFELSKFFPPAILMLDKAELKPVKRAFRDNEELKTWFIPNTCVLDYERIYSSIADKIDSDDRFTIFKLKPYPPQAEVTKIFRSDVAKMNPFLSCSVISSPDTPIEIKFNDKHIETINTNAEGLALIKMEVPLKQLEKASFNTFTVNSYGTNLVSVLNFSLTSEDGYYIDVMKPYSK